MAKQKTDSKVVIEFDFPYTPDTVGYAEIIEDIKDKINETGEVKKFEITLATPISKIKIV